MKVHWTLLCFVWLYNFISIDIFMDIFMDLLRAEVQFVQGIHLQ